MNDTKIVNGINVVLTDAEQAIRNQDITNETNSRVAIVPVVDLTTQVTTLYSTLINKGVISTDDIPVDVAAAINTNITELGKASLGISKVAL